jgi:uncharacterized protein YmfQ (DUF2313 family)
MMARYYQALCALLPKGYAWPRDESSTLMRLMRSLAGSFGELHLWIEETVRQWQPHTTVNRLADWEAAVGLPDDCFGAVTDPIQRRELVLLRLRGLDLTYADSSSAAPASIQQLCAAYGYVVTVKYEPWLRVYSAASPSAACGVGDALGSVGVLLVDMSIGQRLIECSKSPEALLCLLQDFVPARFEIAVLLDGDLTAPV